MSLMEKLTFFGAAHDSIQAEKHRATAALSTNKTLEMSPEAERTAKESAAATRAKQNWKSAKEKVSAKVNAAQVKDRERVDPLHRLASQQMARGEASLAMETHEERTARHESRARHRTRRNSAIDVNWLAEDVGAEDLCSAWQYARVHPQGSPQHASIRAQAHPPLCIWHGPNR
jgi:hypothetical protein